MLWSFLVKTGAGRHKEEMRKAKTARASNAHLVVVQRVLGDSSRVFKDKQYILLVH